MAKVHLNDRVLRARETSEVQEDLWDDSLPGFGVRVGKGGRKTFFLRPRVRGIRTRVNLGQYPYVSLQEARDRARKIIGARSRGESVVVLHDSAAKGARFSDLVESYLEWAGANKRASSMREEQRLLEKNVLPELGHLSAMSVTKADVRRVLDELISRGAPVSANRALAVIRRIFNWGMERDLVMQNPCAGLKRPTKEFARERALTWTEIARAWAAWEEQSDVIEVTLKLLLLTGKRVGEVRQMRWRDIDNEVWTVPAQFSKSKRDLPVPLSGAVLELLERRRELGTSNAWVLAGADGEPVKYFALRSAIVRMKARLGFDWTIHDLRRTAMTRMAEIGVDKELIPILLGHARKEVTDVYNRWAYLREMREALELWASHLVGVVGAARERSGVAHEERAHAEA